ncbi:hypothetical protein Acor_46700 [Acrocarpospora corrugata]|uniref:Uncharacterized protein n=2 Tax=Acrocarpospora corrugata TaxID=35763 RepID=A0A5M3W1K4_9ACTN|nr:hypothetical protein Acor_46700 [Acrocarpospora corrugata]
MHPGVEGLDRRRLRQQFRDRVAHRRQFVAVGGLDQRLAGGEMPVKRADSDPRLYEATGTTDPDVRECVNPYALDPGNAARLWEVSLSMLAG